MSESEIHQAALTLAVDQRVAFVMEKCGSDHAQKDRILKKLLEWETYQSGQLPVESEDGFVSFWGNEARAEPNYRELDFESTLGTFKPGQRIGAYQLIQSIGIGGMGAVWLAEQSEPVKRRVALKVIKNWGSSKETLARFDAERQALAMMNHPNIARILDAGETPDGQPYFAMEFVSGKPLTTYCDQNRLGIDERLKLFVDVCNGVQHAHQKGIIHRDLKPGNIIVGLIDGKAVAKVIDFGLAKAFESGQRLTDQSLFTGIGQILGTLKYMSPEQASLETLDIDTRTDIYALGVVLYELLTGSTPLDDSSVKGQAALKILEIIREVEPVKPSSRLGSSSDEQVSSITNLRRTDSARLNRVLTGDLDWIVMKALEKDRTRRYESASGFAADIQRYLNSEPVIARPPSLNYRIRKFVRKNRVWVMAASLVFVAFFCGIIGTTLAMLRAWDAEQLAAGRLVEAVAARREESKQREMAEERRKDADLAREIAENRRIDAEKNLAYARTGNEILSSVFADLDPESEYREVSDLRNALGDNLQKAVERLDGQAIGDPLVVAEMQMRLGASLQGLGKDAQAIVPLERALKARTEILGVDHRDTQTSMNDLALSYNAEGLLEKAIQLHEKTLAWTTVQFGPHHSSTLSSMANLSACYMKNGQVKEAQELTEQSLKLSEEHLGPNHIITLTNTHNVALIYRYTGQLNKALPIFERALELNKAILGIDHPDTLVTMNELAACYRDSGQLDKALPLLELTLKTSQSKLGNDHRDTISKMNNLATIYSRTGQFSKALPLYEQTLERVRTKLGDTHPHTRIAMGNLARCYQEMDQPQKALPLWEQLLDLILAESSDHPEKLPCLSSLAECYRDAGQPRKALLLWEQLLELHETKLGIDHPDTIDSQRNLLEAYAQAGDVDKFEQLFSNVLPGWRRSLKKKGRQLAAELAFAGYHFLQLQRALEAEPLLRESFRMRQALEPDMWRTFNTQALLGRALLAQAQTVTDEPEKAKLLVEAETQLTIGYEGMKQREASIPSQVVTGIPEALDRIIELYTLLDRPSQVEAYRNLRASYPVGGEK